MYILFRPTVSMPSSSSSLSDTAAKETGECSEVVIPVVLGGSDTRIADCYIDVQILDEGRNVGFL